ncbi:MAG: ATP-dependent DNA helicase, partial [Planctomycetota bacterium]
MIRANAEFDINEVLAPGGPISKSLPGFEIRPQQVDMARAVQRTLAGRRHLAVEAGTGVGKSFAYLVPTVDSVCREATKVLISTFTITLQEQLIDKDIPFLADCMPQAFTAALAKGRANYLCKRRLEFAVRTQKTLFNNVGSELEVIRDWADKTEDGSLSDMRFLPKSHIWDRVKSEHGNCRSRKCPHFHKCFYWRARRCLETADIIVANHALLFSDLVLKEQGVSILPDYRYIIIDEAHNIEHVAEDHFGINVSHRRIKFLLDGLHNPRTRKGLLTYTNADRAIDTVRRLAKETQ